MELTKPWREVTKTSEVRRMEEFKTIVADFISQKLDYSELRQQLESWLAQSPPPDYPALYHYLEGLHEHSQLSSPNYLTLKALLDECYDRTILAIHGPPVLVKSVAAPNVFLNNVFSKNDSKPSASSNPAWSESTHQSDSAGEDELLQSGREIGGNYRLLAKLGEGGMGVVWKAVDLLQGEGEYVAIKFLHENFRQHPEALKTLKSEFGKYKQLFHSNIVRAYHLGREQSLVFLVMEFLEGISLREFIKNHPTGVSLAEAKPILEGMGKALRYAHQQGIVHLDFKPTNVFYDVSTNTVKVIDFGIARRAEKVDRDKTRFDPGQLHAFSESYASLEMLSESESEPEQRDDVYALACVTYELLSGQHPFGKKSAAKAHREKLVPKPIKGLTRHQFRALLHGLAVERENRTTSVTEFLTELFAPRPLRGAMGIALVLLLMIAVVANLGVEAPVSPPPETPKTTMAVKPMTPIVIPTSPEKVPPAKICESPKIVANLAAAEEYLAQSRLIYPDQKNALAMYQEVLKECPTQSQALAGLNKIAEFYKSKAEQSWQKNYRANCLDHVGNGLRAVPQHQGLLELKNRCQLLKSVNK